LTVTFCLTAGLTHAPASGSGSRKPAWQVLASALLLTTASCASLCADARQYADMDLVPPPPPSPALEVPPAPIELPYSYALNGSAYVPEQQAFPKPPTMPRPMSPFRDPAPVHVANSPNLNTAYALVRGFGTPRQNYGAPGQEPAAAGTASANTWFDASLHWYAQRNSSQQFFNDLQHREASAVAAMPPSSAPVAFQPAEPAPYMVPSHHSSHKSHKSAVHFRHARRVIATR
jgi:hypothetical protein